MVLTTVLLVVSTVALPVETGTTSPTCRVATWLLMTTSDGLDSTFTLVTVCKASRMADGLASEPTRKLKPGSARLINALVTVVATFVAVLVVVVVVGACVAWVLATEPLSAGQPKPLLRRNNWTP